MMLNPDEYRLWRWRNLREATIAISLMLFPWQWRLHWERVSRFDEWHALVVIGPFVVKLRADIGNCSTGDWRARFGLSELEAWDRSEP